MKSKELKDVDSNYRISRAKITAKEMGCELTDYSIFRRYRIREIIQAIIGVCIYFLMGYMVAVGTIL